MPSIFCIDNRHRLDFDKAKLAAAAGRDIRGPGLGVAAPGLTSLCTVSLTHAVQVLDERQLDTGIIHHGDMARVRSFMHKLRHGQPVQIGAERLSLLPYYCAALAICLP